MIPDVYGVFGLLFFISCIFVILILVFFSFFFTSFNFYLSAIAPFFNL